MTDAADALPARVAELIQAMIKALRAFQIYLPNNPMYQRAADALGAAFGPVWEVVDDVTLLVDETRLHCDEHVVYDQPSKSDSFAWGLYKDGLRLLRLRRGAEQEEIARFLRTVSRARLLAADASDDLLTLLWEQEFQAIEYRFAEVVSDPWIYDPQAIALEAQSPEAAADAEATREQVQAEMEATPRPAGLVNLEEFDPTLYFLDGVEIAALNGQVAEEYERDVRGAALTTLFELLELVPDPDARAESLDLLELLFPNLLARGEFPTVAMILRESRALRPGWAQTTPELAARLGALEAALSEASAIGQLVQALDEAATPPSPEDLGELFRELRATALGPILASLPAVATPAVRQTLAGAAERLAAAHGSELVALLGTLPDDALPEAMRLAARIELRGAIPILGQLVTRGPVTVRLGAIEALTLLGTPGALAAVTAALEDGERTVRTAAVAAVVSRGYAAAGPRLEAAVLGESGVGLERAERRQVFEAYAVLTGPPALDVLRSVLLPRGLFRRKGGSEARTCAVYALAKLRTPDARALLEQVSADKDLPVRHAASTLLREWPA